MAIVYCKLAFSQTASLNCQMKNLFEKGADPLEACRFDWFFGLFGVGQTPFRIGFKPRQPHEWPGGDRSFAAQNLRT